MSNSVAGAALRLPKFSSDCVLCVAGCGEGFLCPAFRAPLPRLAAHCLRCAVPLGANAICGECLRRAPRFDDALAAFEYRFPLDRLVQRFKYPGDLAIGKWLATCLA